MKSRKPIEEIFREALIMTFVILIPTFGAIAIRDCFQSSVVKSVITLLGMLLGVCIAVGWFWRKERRKILLHKPPTDPKH